MKALAADLGGSHARCAVVEDRAIVAQQALVMDGAESLASVLPLLAASLKALAKRAGWALADCGGVALSFCGIVDSRQNRILATNKKYDDAPAIDLAAWARREFGLALRAENDARMALLGEWHAGAAQGCNDTVMFTLGTGIGGAAMIGGRLLRGRHAQAGCLGGHSPVHFSGRECTCGAIGCAEAEAAGWSLPLICRAWPGFAASALARERRLDFAALFRQARARDAVAIAIRDRCLRVWAVNTVAAIHAFDPEVVVYGGGVMGSAEEIVPFLQAYVERHAWTPWGKVRVRAAKLGNDAALLAAPPLLSGGAEARQA